MEDKLRAEIQTGMQARELLEHPLMAKFIEESEKELWRAFKESSVRNADDREKIRLMLYWLEKFQQWMNQHIQTGTMAKIQLEEANSFRERVRNWL